MNKLLKSFGFTLAIVMIWPQAGRAQNQPADPRLAELTILITPHNIDPADRWEYTRRAGTLAPGCVAFGRVWNRPWPRVRCDLPTVPTKISSVDSAAYHETRQLGVSVLGIPIVGHFFGKTGSKTLIFGAIHGDEPTSAAVARALIEHLINQPATSADQQVVVVPVLNPDGLARQTRTNARQVDLNRNFPAKNFAVGKKDRYFGGNEPASEPETQLLLRLIEDFRPDRIITIHSIERGKHGNNFDGPAEQLAQTMSHHNGYAVLPSIGYPTPGSFGSWAGSDQKIPTITLELPSDATGDKCWQQNRDAVLAAIRAQR